MKKCLIILLVAVLAAGILAGCVSRPMEEQSQAADGAREKVVIRMTCWSSEDTMSELLEYLKEAVPDVEIEYQYIDKSNYGAIIDAQLSSGDGPDIICESPAYVQKHAKLGYLLPLNDYAHLYSEAGTSVYSYEDNVYALPGISWFEGVFYNKEIFMQNNIKLPETFDDYVAVCRQLKDLGIMPLAAGLKSWEPMMKSSMAFVTAEYLCTPEGESFDGNYREGRATLSGAWNPYVEKWSEMVTEDIYTIDMMGIDNDQALEQFAAGEAAMFCSGPSDLGRIVEKNPNMQLGMMPFHGTRPGDGWLLGGPGGGFAINDASAKHMAAKKVLDAISTEEGQKALWQNNKGGYSYLNGVVTDLPEAYEGVSGTLAAGNVYCPWNEWGIAGAVCQDYGRQLQYYLLGVRDICAVLKNVDIEAAELLAG